jgi:hypothetical protein
MTDKPTFGDAPGVVVRPAGEGRGQWEARWQCRTDLVARGFKPASRRLWIGIEPSDIERAIVSDRATRLQDEMLTFSGGGLPDNPMPFDGTLRSLIRCYQTDPDSSYNTKLRYQQKVNYSHNLRRLGDEYGDVQITDIKARLILGWHKKWSKDGQHIPMAKAYIALMRSLMTFGTILLEDDQCTRVRGVLSAMRFKTPKPRTQRLTADMVVAVREEAHKFGYHSIALAQAIQFEFTLRQKDVIGGWVPLTEPGVSDVTWANQKWLYGLRWNEFDENGILRHVTSKTGELLEAKLSDAPMVLEELALYREMHGELPLTGPIVVSELTGKPWTDSYFRRTWRTVANAAGVPKTVRNMDTRAGAITEATEAGAPIEHVKHAATHSDIGMTQRYSRGAAEKVSNVMQFRTQHRNKQRTGD